VGAVLLDYVPVRAQQLCRYRSILAGRKGDVPAAGKGRINARCGRRALAGVDTDTAEIVIKARLEE
jgi:hypothetical protein